MPPNEQTPLEAGEPKSSPPATNVPASTEVGADVTGAAALTPPASPISKQLFWVNLGLFTILVALMTSWFLWHLHRWFTGALFGGLVLVIVPLAYGTVTSIAGDEMKALPAKALGAPGSRKVLILLIVASVAVLFLTSSIYIEYAPAGADTKDCKVEIVDVASKKPFMPPITVTAKDAVGGRPFLFRVFPKKLRFTLAESPGRQPKMETLYPGKRVLLQAPADFPAKQFHVLRIVLGPRLWNNLAEPNDTIFVSYDLVMTIGGKTTQIDDVRRQTLYLGTLQEGIEYVLKTEDAAERRNDFVQQLSALGCPTEQQPGFIDAWTTKRRILPTEEHLPDEAITIALRRRGDGTPIVRDETKKTNMATIQTIVLEMP